MDKQEQKLANLEEEVRILSEKIQAMESAQSFPGSTNRALIELGYLKSVKKDVITPSTSNSLARQIALSGLAENILVLDYPDQWLLLDVGKADNMLIPVYTKPR